MKRIILLQCFFLAAIWVATAQTQTTFNERYKATVKGDMIVVGNTVIGTTKTGDNNNRNLNNNDVKQVFVDIDNDLTTFNSSSAEVKDPNPTSACPRKVKKAYLYWASFPLSERNDWLTTKVDKSKVNKVKFKIDNGAYQEIIGDEVYSNKSTIFIYRADITDKLNKVAGTYTVADLQAGQGRGWGLTAGWTLFIVYEDTSEPARNITLFDGYTEVDAAHPRTVKVSGFKTVPAPLPVNAKIAFAAVEGDATGTGDQLKITTNKISNEVLYAPDRPYNNFFNSTITDENGINYNRKPKSNNMLGFDIGVFKLENANKRILGNDTTEASLHLTSAGDYYVPFMFAFNVEVIEPTVLMSKRVFNSANQDVTGKNTIALGETLRYEIKFQNQGNDNAKDLEITDIITDNLDSSITNITTSDNKITTNYNPANRKLIISVPDELVKKNGKEYTVSFNVKVTNKCNQWKNPCANEIKNIAYATYKGELNNTTTFTPKSSSTLFTACGLGVEGPSNFIVNANFSNCTFKNDPVVLCQPSLVLTATAGFTSYTWSKVGDASFSHTGAAITVTEAGTYKVAKSKTGCATMYEEFEVNPNDKEAAHPIEKKIIDKEISGEIYVCSSDGKKYPQVYLCGKDASLNIKLAVANAESYVWEKMAATCAGKSLDCPASRPSQASCWSAFGTGAEKQITAAGDYRLTITYAGGCVVTYYFRLTKDDTELKATVKNEICNTKGSITIDALGAGFKYALKQNNIIVKSWQTSPVFSGLSAGIYKVLATNPSANTTSVVTCIYEIEKTVLQKTPKLKLTVTNPLCKGGNGSLQVQLSDAPYYPYTYKVYKDNISGALVEQKVITSATDAAAAGFIKALPAGIYVVVVENNDGCTIRATDKIIEPTLLKLDVAPHDIMCNEGTINVSAQGGTKDSNGYTFELYKATTFIARASSQASHTFTITDKGVYTVKVIDANNCETTKTITIQELPAPTIGAITPQLYDCGAKVKIVFPEPQSTVSYTYEYSLTSAKQTSREFLNLTPGQSVTPRLYYTYGGKTCQIDLPAVQLPNAANGNLIASAGVAQLVGCGTGANAGKALVHFTNVQGGVGTITYNFGDGVWTETSSKWLAPGTYNLSVKDGIGCARTNLKVEVKDKPKAPVFSNTSITYTCDGKGSVTIKNDKPSYTYKYQLDGGAETTTAQFSNLSPGIHTITIKYDDPLATQPGILLKEDFGKGNPYTTPPPGMTPAYTLIDPRTQYLNWNTYFVAGKKDLGGTTKIWWDGSAHFPNDHTNPSDNSSRYLAVDFGPLIEQGAIFYEKDVIDVLPNQPIEFEMFGFNLVSSYSGAGCVNPVMIMEIVALDDAGNIVQEGGTDKILGRIESQEIPQNGNNMNAWFRFASDGTGVNAGVSPVAKVNPGTYKRLKIRIRTKWNTSACNDFAFDDVTVYQVPESCGFTATHTIKIEDGKGFAVDTSTEQITSAKCNGELGQYKVKLKNMPNGQYYYAVSGYNNFNFNASTPNNDTFVWNGYAGNYTVKFRGELNNSNCEFTRTFTITQPAVLTLSLDASKSDTYLACNPAIARVTMTATGGTLPYSYALYKGTVTITAAQTSPQFTLTQTGTYRVIVTDANGCQQNNNFTIINAPVLTLTGTTDITNNNYCMSSATAGKVQVKVTDAQNIGTSPYTFFHNGTRVAIQTAAAYTYTNLQVGVHTFTVIDKYGCVASYTTEIKRMITADGSSGVAVVAKDITCHSGNAARGELNFKVKDGYAPYTYIVKNAANTTVQGAQAVPANKIATYLTATPGAYTIEVTDSKGCKVSGTATLTAAVRPTAVVSTTAVVCYGANDGTISLTISGGTAPYKISIDGGTQQNVTGNQHRFTGVTGGNHTVRITDARECYNDITVTVAAPAAPLRGFAVVSKLIGCGDNDGDPAHKNKAKVAFTNVTGGYGTSSDYRYKFDSNFDIYPDGWLPAGTHTVTVRDKAGCELDISVTVPKRIDPPTGTTYTITSYDCDGKGTIRISGLPSTYSYTYTIGGKIATGTTATIMGLTPGSYTMTISYTQGAASCPQEIVKTVVIPGGQEFKASVLSQTNVDCKNNSTGKVTFRVENLRGGSYNVSLSSSIRHAPGYTSYVQSPTFEVDNLEAGTHTITFNYRPAVAGAPTCVVSRTITITEPAELTLTATIVEPAMCSNAHFAKVQVTATGGTGAYTYFYLVGGTLKATNTTGLFTGVATGTPSFVVKDANGCSKQVDLTNFIPTPKTVSFTIQATECYAGDNQGVIKVKIADGNGGYTVSLNGSAAVSPTTDSVTHSFTGLRQGSYTVTVKDQYGCSAQRAIDIYPSLTVKVNVTDQGACTQAKLEVLTSGGANGKEYRFYKAGSTPPPYGTANTYTLLSRFSTPSEDWVVQVKSDLCEKTYTVTLQNVGVATYTQQVVQPECQGTATGKIILANLNGGKPFKIGVQRPGVAGTQTQTGVSGSYTIANAVAGVYTITIQDVFGCSSVRTITIEDKPELMGNFAVASTATCTTALFPLTLTMSSTTFNTYISGTPLRDIYYSINGGAYQQLTTPQAVITPGFAPGTEIRVKFKTVAQGAGPTGVAICSSSESTYKVPHMLSNVTVQTNLGNFANGCNGVNGFTATVTIPSGEGEAPYQFSKDGGLSWVSALSATQSNTAVFTGLEVGRTHTFMVRDNKGCTAAYTGDVYSGTTLGLQVGLVATPNCAAGTGGGLRVELKRNSTASLGSHFDWEIVPPVPGGSATNVPMISAGTATTLITLTKIVPVGTYYVKVTEKNGSSCVWYSRDAKVKQLDPITGTVSVSSNITCDAAGVVEVLNVQGGGGQYTYTLEPVAPTTFVTPIATANNRVQVLRDNISNPNVNTLRYPAAPVTITVKVKVIDQYGCDIDLGNHNLVVQPKPAIYTVTYTGCSNGNFTLVVTPTERTIWAPSTNITAYEYSKDGGLTWTTTNVFANESAGTYVMVVREKNTGCEATQTLTVHDPLEASARVSKLIGCVTGTNAEITIRVDKGSGNYTYNITPPSGTTYTGSTFLPVTGSTASEAVQPIGNTPGTYTVTIKDNGQLHCSPTIVVVSVASPSYPEIKVSTQSVTCFGSTDGSMNIVELGSGNYIYTSIAGPSGPVTAPRWNLGTRSAKDLEAGVYTITVKNNDSGCSTTTVVRVGTPPALTLSATLIQVDQFACGNNGQTNQAKIVVPPTAIAGGTGTRTIEFEDAYGNKVYSNTYTLGIAEGSVVTITLRDASGCYTSVTKTIVPYERIDVANLQVVSATTCQVATVTLTMTKDGVLPFGAGVIYYYEGATAPTVAIGTAPWQTGNTFTVTPNATHKFWIGNKNTGCIVSYDYISPDPNTFRIVDVQTRNIACGSDGTATFTLEGLDSLHTYQVSVTPSGGTINPSPMFAGTNTKFNISGLAAGIYTVTVKDQQTLCEQVQRFSIESPTQTLTATTSVRSITCVSGNNDGEIRIENVSGGWGGYQYHIGTTITPPTASGAWTTTTYKSGLVSDTYYVWVRDNLRKDCPLLVASITMNNPTPISGTLTVTQENCVAGTGEISVATITGGDGVNYTYQLIKDGVKEGIPQSTRTFTGLGAGNYEVVVSDSWGCPATLTLATGKLHEPISNVQVQIVKEVTCASPTGATLSVTHQGGSNSITYTLTPSGGGTTTVSTIPVFIGVPAGSYIVGVKDNKTACAIVTTTIEVTPAVPVAFTYTQTNVGCHGGNNGRIDVTIPGTQTQTDYVIQIEGAGGFITRTETVNTTPKDFSILGLKAGVYTVTVYSSRACQSSQTITITEPAQLVVSSTTVTTHFSCDTNNQARQAIVQAIAAGGVTGTYTYNFEVFDGQSTSTTGYTNSSVVSISSNGSYTQTVVVYVRDANGCTANSVNSPTVIPPLKRITAIKAQQTRPIDCQGLEAVDFTIEGGSNQGYIVRVTGGTTTPSIYTVTSGVSVVSVTFTAPGYYEVTVTDSATGCYDSVNYGIANYDNISISAAQTKPVTCAAGNDGELTLSMRGYAGNYTFRVVNEYGVEVVSSTAGRNDTSDPRTQPIGGLSAGKYYVEVTETQYPYCTKTATLATLSGPSSALTASTTITNQIKCGSGQTGSFMVTAAGGWGNYEYRLTVGTPTPAAHSVYGNYSSTSVFEGLVSETYTVWVKDQNGCETSVTQVMSPPAPIAATVTKTDVKCFSERGGSITVSGTTGGSGNYTYELWEVGGAQIYGAQTSTTFTGLDAREYKVKIVDGWNCDLTIPVTIDEPQEIKVTASIVSPTTCLQTQATIQVTATGGSGSYQYRQGTSGTFTTNNLFTLPPGTYEFYVQDANGCPSAASNKVEVVAVQPVSLTVNTADAFVKCNGEATARITFSATGGVGGYQYSLHHGNPIAPAMTISATQINATDWAFSGLATGTYFVKVKSGVDCEDNSSQIDIREADAISVTSTVSNVTCKGEKDGKIIVTAEGGTGTIVYAISPRFDRVVESGVFEKLAPGEYVVRIQDANGCHRDEIFKITEPDLIRVRIDRQTDEVCYGANDGTISVTITGGTQSYSTSIDGGVNWYLGKTLYTGLASGTYIIKVKDAMSCTTESDPITIKGGVDLQATATVEYSCPSNSVNNAIRVRVNTDVAAQTTFALDGVAQASNYFTSVTAGVHTITVRHQGGCVQTLTVNVENYAPLSKTVSVTHITCYGEIDGKVQINVTGGTGSYTYSITPQAGTFSGTNMFVNLPKGQYTIQVKDAVIGCEVSERITIEEPDVLKLGVVKTVTETCYQQSDGQLEFMIQGGRAPYSYELKDSQGNVIDTRMGIATGTTVSRTNMAPGAYSLVFRDGNCPQTQNITIAAAPSLQATATVGFECSTVSTTSSNPYIQITLARDNSDGLISSQTLSYSINGEPIKPFVGYVDGNLQVLRTRNIENNGIYTITIFYRPLGMTSLCSSTLAGTVSVTRYPGLEILDKTDPREINKVRVKVVGGNPREGDTPYSITFNGSYENGESEYMLKPTDPTSRVVNGRIFKLVVVEAIDANNCSSTLTIEKEYMKSVPPDFFTPNGDGQNDGWDPDIYRSYPNLTVDIYDRYGRYIKTLRSGQVWDGRYEGKEMPSGDYWYILRTHEDDDRQEYMGHFTLYR
ncbi:gliding motility-associated-like protein [Capnocytophaga leadbetteri]|uniref:Gliding motility-associated-like protein n=1 Tax=Capnocytophaga leadbetteri TaxID=327575 RepID=A0A2T5XZC4_9FLAO|nr:T9SS type B sorting domain-containing protein [Capnocytophaga leadbetteri]PTX08889.1 gliding motility-associated-like protein [Capnocytophaga leadbetteri]